VEGVVIDLGQVSTPATITFPLSQNNALAVFSGGAWNITYSPVPKNADATLEVGQLLANPASGDLVVNGSSLAVIGITPDTSVLGGIAKGTEFAVSLLYAPPKSFNLPTAGENAIFNWVQGRNRGSMQVTFMHGSVDNPTKWTLKVA